jgi:UPF0271 protein
VIGVEGRRREPAILGFGVVGAPVFLNIDLGELPGEAEELYALAQVANVACGGHAGDEASMRRAVSLCEIHGAAVGAHPSYADRAGFGRTRMDIPPDELRHEIASQCARLAAIAREAGVSVAFVKAHGALYHAASDDTAIADAVVLGAREALGARITVIGPPPKPPRVTAGAMARAAALASLVYAREGFADRATRADGSLVPRGEAGAVIADPGAAVERARALLVARGIDAIDTLCVHGDTPGAVAVARAVRAALDAAARP